MKNFGFLAGLKKRASKLNMVSDGKHHTAH